MTNLRSPNRTVTVTVTDTVRVTSHWVPERTIGSGDDHEFVGRTSEFLSDRTWKIVTKVTYGGTQCSCSCEPDYESDDLGFLTEWTVGVGGVLNWCRR